MPSVRQGRLKAVRVPLQQMAKIVLLERRIVLEPVRGFRQGAHVLEVLRMCLDRLLGVQQTALQKSFGELRCDRTECVNHWHKLVSWAESHRASASTPAAS